MRSKNALAAIRGDLDHGKDGHHRPCLDALIHDPAGGRVDMASITYLDDQGLKVPAFGHPCDPAFEVWADRKNEIAGRIIAAREAARRATDYGEVVPRPQELIFDIASRVPAAGNPT